MHVSKGDSQRSESLGDFSVRQDPLQRLTAHTKCGLYLLGPSLAAALPVEWRVPGRKVCLSRLRVGGRNTARAGRVRIVVFLNTRLVVKPLVQNCSPIYLMILCNPIGYADENTVTLSFEDFGKPAYPSLAAAPGAIDLVNIFRKSKDVLPLVEEAITHGAKAIWMQEGISNEQAAVRARESGLLVVMDRCWLKEQATRSHRG